MKKERPSGFVAICRCGSVVGCLDYARTDRKEAGKIIGEWLDSGCTVEPRFGGHWFEKMSACSCRLTESTADKEEERNG